MERLRVILSFFVGMLRGPILTFPICGSCVKIDFVTLGILTHSPVFTIHQSIERAVSLSLVGVCFWCSQHESLSDGFADGATTTSCPRQMKPGPVSSRQTHLSIAQTPLFTSSLIVVPSRVFRICWVALVQHNAIDGKKVPLRAKLLPTELFPGFRL